MSGITESKQANFAQGQDPREQEGTPMWGRPLPPISGVSHPTRREVMNMTAFQNIQNLSGQLGPHVIQHLRMVKQDFPDGTGRYPKTPSIKATMAFPGSPNTEARGHDPVSDSPPTDYFRNPEAVGVERHPHCTPYCTGACGGHCSLMAHRLHHNETTIFPKMSDAVSDAGVTTRTPGGGHKVTR